MPHKYENALSCLLSDDFATGHGGQCIEAFARVAKRYPGKDSFPLLYAGQFLESD